MSDRLGIIEIRNIIRAVQETYNIDFSDYALTSFKRRLEKVIRVNNYSSSDDLIIALKQNSDTLENFLFDISVDDTEMFRDPSLWRELKDELFPKIITNNDFRIWMPCCTSGEELYSLAILLREANLTGKTQVIASSISSKCIEFIKSGIYDIKKMELNIANYKRAKGNTQLTDYYILKNNRAYMDTSLLKDVEFQNINIFTDKTPSKVNVIIYRNKMIYYNLPLQIKALDIMYNSLVHNGLLAIGIKETLDTYNTERKFVFLNEEENIFKKVM